MGVKKKKEKPKQKQPMSLLGKVGHGSSKRKLARKPWLCKMVTLGSIPPHFYL